MSIEQKINYQLNKYPKIKKIIKRVYQRTMYIVSKKIKSEGNIVRMSPDDSKHEYFFGYYDKSPWDITDRYLLCLKANDTWSNVSPKEIADILLIDTEKEESDLERYKKIAETRSWNVQQGCMLQWLGPDYSSRIIYNDYRDNKYCSVILTIANREERIIDFPVYTVSNDGKIALSLDFSRLYNLRPGYGYYNVPEKTNGVALPDSTAVWKIDLESGSVIPLLKYTDFASFQPRPEMQVEGSVHKVNHLMISPSGQRFMVLYRWFNGQRKFTRLITCNIDGTDMYVLSDDDMVSHCCWMDDNNILAFENKKESGSGYYLMKDKTQKYVHFWKGIDYDGHPSFSPDGSEIVFDRYPDKARVAGVFVCDSKEQKTVNVNTVVKVFAPFKYDNDTRCDLHPRWNRVGDKICFDSVYEGHRGLYIVDTGRLVKEKEDKQQAIYQITPRIKYSLITPVYNSFGLMDRYFDGLLHQTYKNFEVILIDDGSTDGTYEKLVEYQKSTPLNLKVFKTKINSGPGNARNIGIMAAKGKWITFIDNDDWVVKDFLEKIDMTIKQYNADCIIYDYFIQRVSKKKTIAKSVINGVGGYIPADKCIMNVTNHTFGKFYQLSKCIENEIMFPNTRRCEDVAFTILAVSVCKKIYYLEEPLYYYYQRCGSLSNNNKLDEKDMVQAFSVLQEKLEYLYPHQIEEKSVRDLLYGCVLMMCKSGKSTREIKNYINEYEKRYPNWYQCEMVHKVGKAKQAFLICAKYRQIAVLKGLSYVHTKLVTG